MIIEELIKKLKDKEQEKTKFEEYTRLTKQKMFEEQVEMLKSVFAHTTKSIEEYLKKPSKYSVEKIIEQVVKTFETRESCHHDVSYQAIHQSVEMKSKLYEMVDILFKLEDIESLEKLLILLEHESLDVEYCKKKAIAYMGKLALDEGYATQSRPIYLSDSFVGSWSIKTILKLDAILDKKEAQSSEYYMSERTRQHIIKACVGYYGPYKSYLYKDEPFVHEDDMRKDFEIIHKEEYEKLRKGHTSEVAGLEK